MTVTSAPIKALLASAILVSLAACSSGGGGSGPGTGGGGPTGGVIPHDALKTTSEGSFTSEKEGALGTGGLAPKELTLPSAVACTAGKPKDIFDPKLARGQKFVETFGLASPDRMFSMTEASVVTESSDSTVTVDQEVRDFVMVPAPTTAVPSVVKKIETCTVLEGSDSPACESNYVGETPPFWLGDSTTCTITNEDYKSSKGTASLGTYRLKSGDTVRASRIERVTPVTVVCRFGVSGTEQNMGNGTEILTMIETNQLVTRHRQLCYVGTVLYSHRSLVLADGRVMDVSRGELLAAPKR